MTKINGQMMIVTLLWLLQSLGINADQTTCLQTLFQLSTIISSKDPQKIIIDIFPYISKSGLSLNAWGDYDACQRSKYVYSSMRILVPNVGWQYIGICHASTCTASDLNQNQGLIKAALKAIGVINYYLFDQIDLSSIYFDFQDPNETVPNPGFGTYFIAFILIFLVAISMVITFYNIYVNFLNRKERYEKIYSVKMNINSIMVEEDKGSGSTSIALEKKVNPIFTFFEYFSLPKNFKSLIDLKTPDPLLCIFNGFRSFAFLMVVYGHQHSIILVGTNVQELVISLNGWWAVWLMDMLYSVDMFFWIGGFFLGFVACEVKKIAQIKKGGIGAIFIMITHRILRIWPCYLITILILWKIFPYLGDGPRWFLQQTNSDCSTWWRNMLFIDNLFDDSRYCMGWGWYLSNDIQLFLVSLVPIYIYAKISPKAAKISIVVLLVGTQIVGTIVTFHYELLIPYWAFVDATKNVVLFNKYYLKPWCRGPPYFLGLLVGILYREYKAYISKPQSDVYNSHDVPFFQQIKLLTQNTFQKQMTLIILCYLIGGSIMGVILFGWRNCQVNGVDSWNQTFQMFWFAFCRIFFTFGMTLISLPCFLGYKDSFNTAFMSCGFFRYLAKISFTGYMIHYIIILITSSTYYETPSFNAFNVFQYFIG